MASRIALVLVLNIIFFTLVSSHNVPCPPPPPPPCPPSSPSPPQHHHSQHPPPPPTHRNKPTSCGIDALKLKVCANVLNLVDVSLGPKTECCALIKGLVDLEAAVCLCTALKANILGINLNVPIKLSLLLNLCHKDEPKGFQCA